MLLFLLIIKNYRIQDATYSEADSKCEIGGFSKLQIPGGGGGGGKGAPSGRFTYGVVT